jgi:hypothetical protein
MARKPSRRTASRRVTGRRKPGPKIAALRRPTRRRPAARKTTASRRKPAKHETRSKARKVVRRSAPVRRRVPPALNRERRRLVEEPPAAASPARTVQSDDADRYLGAALTGQDELVEKLLEHTETGPGLTGGDLDGNWEAAYSTGDEAPGGDNPTPDQAGVDDNARALGIHYDDSEELKLGEKEAERDRHRWEFDPASAEDYRDRK